MPPSIFRRPPVITKACQATSVSAFAGRVCSNSANRFPLTCSGLKCLARLHRCFLPFPGFLYTLSRLIFSVAAGYLAGAAQHSRAALLTIMTPSSTAATFFANLYLSRIQRISPIRFGMRCMKRSTHSCFIPHASLYQSIRASGRLTSHAKAGTGKESRLNARSPGPTSFCSAEFTQLYAFGIPRICGTRHPGTVIMTWFGRSGNGHPGCDLRGYGGEYRKQLRGRVRVTLVDHFWGLGRNQRFRQGASGPFSTGLHAAHSRAG